MLIEQDKILAAKEKLGYRNADIIADLLHMEKYDANRHVGCCTNPNHDDHKPSFSYHKESHSFRCFSCGYKTDIIEAYMTATSCSFIEACKNLFREADMEGAVDWSSVGKTHKDYRYPHPETSDKARVYEYLAKRGISAATADAMQIGADRQGNVVFHYYDDNDTLLMVKYRPARPVEHGENKCWCQKGADTTPILFNMNRINPQEPLIICCGELDAASAYECGMTNVVSIPLGDGNTHWIDTTYDWLEQFHEIILVHDNDDAGRKFVKEVTTRLGEYRIKVCDVPEEVTRPNGSVVHVKDLNEFYYWTNRDCVQDIIMSAKEMEIPCVVDFADITQFDQSMVDGFRTGFVELDRAIGKMYLATTNIITGIPGAGKSSFINALISAALDDDMPCFLYSGELMNRSEKQWLINYQASQRHMIRYEDTVTKEPYYKVSNDAYNAISEFYRGKLFLYKDGFEQKASNILKTAETLVRRNGVKVIIVDNMTSMDLECSANDKWEMQERLVRDLITFSVRYNVCVFVVIHPKKLTEIRRMTLFDLAGVSAAANLAHRVFALYRVQEKDKLGVMSRNGKVITPAIPWDIQLEVLKDRFGSSAGRQIGLYYDKVSRRFFDTYDTLAHKYDWEHYYDYRGPELPYGCPQLDEQAEVFGEIPQGE